MIKIKLEDLNLVENFKAIQEIRRARLFDDKDVQEMYNEQVKADLEKSYKGEIENDQNNC